MEKYLPPEYGLEGIGCDLQIKNKELTGSITHPNRLNLHSTRNEGSKFLERDLRLTFDSVETILYTHHGRLGLHIPPQY